jgi:hypothetical protein
MAISSLTPFTMDDISLSLSTSQSYLRESLSRLIGRLDAAPFRPESIVRMHLDKNKLPHLIIAGDFLDHVIMLADIERWVEEHLSSWSEGPKSGHDCTTLVTLMKAYMKVAQDEYRVSNNNSTCIICSWISTFVFTGSRTVISFGYD